MLNKQLSKLKSNPIGAVAGAGVSFMATKKYVSKKWWALGLSVLAGAVIGANVQSAVSAKIGAKKSGNQAKK